MCVVVVLFVGLLNGWARGVLGPKHAVHKPWCEWPMTWQGAGCKITGSCSETLHSSRSFIVAVMPTTLLLAKPVTGSHCCTVQHI